MLAPSVAEAPGCHEPTWVDWICTAPLLLLVGAVAVAWILWVLTRGSSPGGH